MVPVSFQIRDRGATPRGMKRVYNASSKASWEDAGTYFHSEMSDDRFTHRHATLAGFAARTKAYTSRKLKKFGHTNPLEYSGRSRRLSRTANITSTSKGASVRYPGLNTLNFRNPKARVPINMADEFRRVTTQEADQLASVYDRSLDRSLNADSTINP